MPAKQLKMSLLQVFFEMTTQRNGFGQNFCAGDQQACVFGSCECNKHSVLRTFIGVETAALTFRTKQYSTSYSSHICYGKRLYNDFFLNHHTIALVNNFLKLLNCVVIETVLDLVKKRINYLNSLLSTRKDVPFNIKSYCFECNDCNACSQTTMAHRFAFGYFLSYDYTMRFVGYDSIQTR